MKIEFSDIAQVMDDYLLWASDYNPPEWEEFSAGKCKSVPLSEAIGIYLGEVDHWMNAN